MTFREIIERFETENLFSITKYIESKDGLEPELYPFGQIIRMWDLR